MTPDQFISKWRAADLTERAASQSHFIDLCALLGVKAPYVDDPTDGEYAFEKGAAKVGGGDGWADVWKRGCFGWEYKGRRRDLDAALKQLQQYALALENPPLLIVSDMDRFRIHTNWTATVSRVHELQLEDLRNAANRELFKNAFSIETVERLKPGSTRQALTEDAARRFADLATTLRERGHNAQAVAHFIQRLVFCMFAEDVKLLPDRMFVRMLEAVRDGQGEFVQLSRELFAAMRSGGRIGLERVAYFNGGLFEDDATLPLESDDVGLLIEVARKDWSDVDPTIFGTMFERGLDPDKRAQLGAHYSDPDKIMRIIEPTVIRPLARQWDIARTAIGTDMARAVELDKKNTVAAKGQATRAIDRANRVYRDFLDRVRAFRVLDPACGSGNFLYIALHALMDLEHRAGIEAERLGLQRELPNVGPSNVLGIELNPYAAELARVTIWIGWLQWMRKNGFTGLPEPILSVLSQIECRDAILSNDGTEALWPTADAIVGNPPFLGDRKMSPVLGTEYVAAVRAAYAGRVPGGADLVCYWFERARSDIVAGTARCAGLVATNSIRFGLNRRVLDALAVNAPIFSAWPDEPWVVDGADVRVSLICFGHSEAERLELNGEAVEQIRSDLTPSVTDLTKAVQLKQNRRTAFQGVISYGDFEIDGPTARGFLAAPANANGVRNSSVVLPWANGEDIIGRPQDLWIIFFPDDLSREDAAFYERPFEHLDRVVRPYRQGRPGDDRRLKEEWWKLWRSRGDFFHALKGKSRYIATVRHAKHRTFRWLPAKTVPDSALVAVARDDDLFFGLVHSRFHEAWALRLASSVGVGNDPRYSHTATFRTFPFPEGLSPDVLPTSTEQDPRFAAISSAAKILNEQREAWLNPPELVTRERECVDGFPERLIAADAAAALELQKRTLTELYNDKPAWLVNAHEVLDSAVAAAYGWPADITTDDALAQLFVMNQRRGVAEA